MSEIYQIYGTDAHAMTMALMERADIISRIPEGADVALKPNLVIAANPETGATTHPGVLSGVIEYLQAHGIEKISVIEGSWIGDRTDAAMHRAGYDRVCKQYNVPFYDLKKDETRSVKTPIGNIDICKRALDAGYLIDLPVLKGHGQTLMTCALKNLKGCLPDREKRHFHALGLHKPIAALASVLKPHLIIVDSLCGDMDFEEGGNPVRMDRMFLGFDPVQIDAYGCSLMGIDPEDVGYIGYAEQWRAGRTAFSEKDIINLNEPSSLKAPARPSGIVARLTKNVHQDSACSACFAALARALYNSHHGLYEEVYIGQGFKGKTLEGLGIGNCCKSATHCAKGCPPTAEEILKYI